MLDLFAAVVVVATFGFIIRGAEVRLALLAGGAVLVVASGKPDQWFNAFATNMVIAGLITVILPALGFAAVIRLGKCDEHLINFLISPLLRFRALIIPSAMLVTLLLATSITSAAGITAAVGMVLIPAMIAMGVHPAMAAAAVIAGTWGPVFSPGSPHPALIADIAKSSVMDVIFAHVRATVPAALVYAAVLWAVARFLGEDRGRATEIAAADAAAGAAPRPQVNYWRAAMPMLPLFLLVISQPQIGLLNAVFPKGISVLQAMVVGTLVTALVARLSPGEVSKTFFDGMGGAYAGVIGIIIAAGVFIAGLNAIGTIERMIDLLKSAQSAAPVAAMVGTFVVAVLSGSGDAATIAFNKAVLPHAAQLGMSAVDLGSIAWVAGAMGRGMSPVAAATAIAAGYAGVSVFEIAKRTAIPAIVSGLLVLLILAFL